jgi:hypothetical protein
VSESAFECMCKQVAAIARNIVGAAEMLAKGEGQRLAKIPVPNGAGWRTATPLVKGFRSNLGVPESLRDETRNG